MDTTSQTKSQKSTFEKIKNAKQPVVLPVSAARVLVKQGLIRSDGSKGHGKAKAAYVVA